jgi:hypothetical protein
MTPLSKIVSFLDKYYKSYYIQAGHPSPYPSPQRGRGGEGAYPIDYRFPKTVLFRPRFVLG